MEAFQNKAIQLKKENGSRRLVKEKDRVEFETSFWILLARAYNKDSQCSGKVSVWWLDNSVVVSVTRFGDLLDFGQLFKAFGNN